MNLKKQMEDLKNEIFNCRTCDLHTSRKHVIFGEGNYNAPIMLIGEAPGADEDRVGRPFIGRSGQLLDKILDACGFNRTEHVFITNIVRCRPPGNRVPTDAEVNACIPYLYKQIQLVDPKIIITLGSTALKRLFKNNQLKITKLRGQLIPRKERFIMPVYHPSALLRNPGLKRETWEDFKNIVHKYREIIDSEHYSAHV